MCSFRSTERFSRKGKWCLWDQGGAVEDYNDGKSERDGDLSRHPWSRGGAACAPCSLPPVCFMGCDNMVVSVKACVHTHFLVCYGNMGVLFFYLYSLWSLGSRLSEKRTLNSPTRSHGPHNQPLSRGIRGRVWCNMPPVSAMLEPETQEQTCSSAGYRMEGMTAICLLCMTPYSPENFP